MKQKDIRKYLGNIVASKKLEIEKIREQKVEAQLVGELTRLIIARDGPVEAARQVANDAVSALDALEEEVGLRGTKENPCAWQGRFPYGLRGHRGEIDPISNKDLREIAKSRAGEKVDVSYQKKLAAIEAKQLEIEGAILFADLPDELSAKVEDLKNMSAEF